MTLNSSNQHRWMRLGTSVLLLVLLSLAGCGKPNGKQATDQLGAASTSASCLLGPDDYEKFRPGRSQTEILNDIQWRGNFEFATRLDGKTVTAISYGLFGGIFRDHGTSVLALFVDEKFRKFVRWPEGEQQIRIGDFSILARALDSNPVQISDLEKEMQSIDVPTHTDPGLTVVWLALRAAIEAGRAPGVKRNAALRDQFNAARLKIGMQAAEVEAVFQARPIASGDAQTGQFKIYGSTESFDFTSDLHYSNVLVALEDGRVTGIYSGRLVPGGDGLRAMREWFVDLRE